MIKPTVGRVVWFRYIGDPAQLGPPRFGKLGDQPFSAQVAYVHSDDQVNLIVTDHHGQPWAFEHVPLWHGEGDPLQLFAGRGVYCEWMPYQKGQAAKTEALEAKLTS